MNVNQTLRILSHWWGLCTLKEHYWALRTFMNRWQRSRSAGNGAIAAVISRDLRAWRGGDVSESDITDDMKQRCDAAAAWLLRGWKATADDGVSLGYFPCDGVEGDGWKPSYPETTGYIMHSLLDYGDTQEERRTEEIRSAVRRMGMWEAEVQMASGAVQGGPVVPQEQQVAAVFNTGMVLRGWEAVLAAGLDDATIQQAARKAADFLLNDMGDDGHFRSHGAFVRSARVKTYNVLCAWALFLHGRRTGEKRYCDGAERALDAALNEQEENGWFRHNCLDRPDAPLLHTIGYTLQGVLEVGVLAEREDAVLAVRRGVDALVEQMAEDGFLHGRWFSDWQPASFTACLTGTAQLAIVAFRLSQVTGERSYRHAGMRMVRFLQRRQRLDSGQPGIDGALGGSFPLTGHYMRFGYPNWATKYLLDALLLAQQGNSSDDPPHRN
ncbi:MAG: hypothetical protein HQL50_11340 [Magnetococcales bacterium]|nr:hypothetical protein [Magnetococcales bacterium]